MTAVEPLPSQVLAERVLRLRSRHLLTQDELAARMQTLGYSWVRSTIAKIELGRRQVTVDELCALATALEVPPIALLIPASGWMRTTPNSPTMDSATAWMWAGGNAGGPTFADDPEAWERFWLESFPDFCSRADRRLPGLSVLRMDAALAAVYAGTQASDPVQYRPGALVEVLERVSLAAQHLLETAKQRDAASRDEIQP